MDDIKRKLALIDKQLARPKDFHKQIFSTSPLAFCAIGLIAGILVQNTFDLTVPIWLILLTLLVTVTVLFFVIRRSSANHQSPITNYKYATAYLALICFLCLGAIRLISFNQPGAGDIRNFVGDVRKLATIRGVIITEPIWPHRLSIPPTKPPSRIKELITFSKFPPPNQSSTKGPELAVCSP